MKKTLIIAEAGVNHNGDLNLAKKLIEIAADSGADFVKFQSFKAKNCISTKAKKAPYQL
ncbi:N-acetylneuraminate synthase family protein, partial [Campylobacter coli]|nr:N-acetylneuraminate synthase family protein [Campylobacter coli]MCD4861792.1 N-acetylneuraminate synthase family protein [Campylobacter coli]